MRQNMTFMKRKVKILQNYFEGIDAGMKCGEKIYYQ